MKCVWSRRASFDEMRSSRNAGQEGLGLSNPGDGLVLLLSFAVYLRPLLHKLRGAFVVGVVLKSYQIWCVYVRVGIFSPPTPAVCHIHYSDIFFYSERRTGCAALGCEALVSNNVMFATVHM
jgi:hypothetical protein